MRQRPEHLPEFANPPLTEVVLDVQFKPSPEYSTVHAVGAWELFKSDFPKVEEWPLIKPQYELFGFSDVRDGSEFEVAKAPVGSRFWFISEDESHLLQLQPDRFITNWRKEPNSKTYPRFEYIADSHEQNFRRLEKYFSSSLDWKISIDQAEVSYHNVIFTENLSQANDWLNFFHSSYPNTDSVSANFSELILKDGDATPYARLRCSLQSGFNPDTGQKAFKLVLTFRGKPAGQDLSSTMEFLLTGREKIVTRFAEITTSTAHQLWERQK